MSTITYSTPAVDADEAPAAEAKSFWTKMYEHIVSSQQARAERAVASYLASHGGLITDDMEREIMARLSGNGGLRRPN